MLKGSKSPRGLHLISLTLTIHHIKLPPRKEHLHKIIQNNRATSNHTRGLRSRSNTSTKEHTRRCRKIRLIEIILTAAHPSTSLIPILTLSTLKILSEISSMNYPDSILINAKRCSILIIAPIICWIPESLALPNHPAIPNQYLIKLSIISSKMN